MDFNTLGDFDFRGKKVLVRLDLNVSLDKSGKINDVMRIKAALPTLEYLVKNNAAKIILMSHLGRPDGKVVQALRLDGVGVVLEEFLGEKISKLDDCIGQSVKKAIGGPGRIFLLENLRFHKEEESNDSDFAKSLAALADVYVNDAFGVCHRSHASVDAVTRFMPGCAGLLLEREVRELSKVMEPEHPFVLIVGGAKVSGKVGVLENIGKKADRILIGGAMPFTFLKSEGISVGKSMVEDDKMGLAKSLMNGRMVLPEDFVISSKSLVKTVPFNEIPDDAAGMDIGEKTIDSFVKIISSARTIVWNGPMGMFEDKKFEKGTISIGKAISGSNGTTIVGGGDTLAAIDKLKLDSYTHISTGGGAMLEFLEGRSLPALEALGKAKK
ncbi:phosphoglycerate kinase [Candidatus Woesearchaeota archaeon]|nr:phosphoglycerate kinase [Candidatus Woesearchaeota archaeon]